MENIKKASKRTNLHFSFGNIGYPVLAVAFYLLTIVIAALIFMARELLVGIISGKELDLEISKVFGLNTMLVYSIMQIIIFSIMLFKLKHRGRPYLFKRIPQFRAWILVPVIAVGGVGFSLIWTNLLLLIAKLIPKVGVWLEQYTSMFNNLNLNAPLWLIILVFSVLVPIAEELLFRGLILSELKLFLPKYVAVVISGLLFGVFHGNFVQGVYAAAIGIVLGLVYLWTESIWASILMHMVFNLVGGVLPIIFQRQNIPTAWINITVMLFAILAIFALIYLSKMARQAVTVAYKSKNWPATTTSKAEANSEETTAETVVRKDAIGETVYSKETTAEAVAEANSKETTAETVVSKDAIGETVYSKETTAEAVAEANSEETTAETVVSKDTIVETVYSKETTAEAVAEANLKEATAESVVDKETTD